MTAVSRLHAFAVVAAGALAILALSACVASAGPNAIPAGALVVTRSAASQPVSNGFVGLSMEYRGLAAYAGTDPRAIDPPFLFFKFGLKLGETWKCSSSSGDKTIKGVSKLNHAEVTVPYRKLEKLQALTVSFKADDGRIEVEYWFVKDIGMVKQRVKVERLDIVLELEKFAK